MNIKLTLESFGYEVHISHTVPRSYEKELDIMPDLILMDIILKEEIDGYLNKSVQIKSF